ncbi:MAG: hypothetical protein AAF570_04800, partial [Bacteroidota bacterium]
MKKILIVFALTIFLGIYAYADPYNSPRHAALKIAHEAFEPIIEMSYDDFLIKDQKGLVNIQYLGKDEVTGQ